MKRAVLGVVLSLPLLGQYQYYRTDNYGGVDQNAWQWNGSLASQGAGLTSQDVNGGALISKLAVPDLTSDYEVRTRVGLMAAGGAFVHYLRATQDARTGPAAAGTFYAAEWRNVDLTNGCRMTLVVTKRVGGVYTEIWSS